MRMKQTFYKKAVLSQGEPCNAAVNFYIRIEFYNGIGRAVSYHSTVFLLIFYAHCQKVTRTRKNQSLAVR